MIPSVGKYERDTASICIYYWHAKSCDLFYIMLFLLWIMHQHLMVNIRPLTRLFRWYIVLCWEHLIRWLARCLILDFKWWFNDLLALHFSSPLPSQVDKLLDLGFSALQTSWIVRIITLNRFVCLWSSEEKLSGTNAPLGLPLPNPILDLMSTRSLLGLRLSAIVRTDWPCECEWK
jgi:hypothetical protein